MYIGLDTLLNTLGNPKEWYTGIKYWNNLYYVFLELSVISESVTTSQNKSGYTQYIT